MTVIDTLCLLLVAFILGLTVGHRLWAGNEMDSIEVEIEQHDDKFMAYESTSKKFLCQDKTKDDLIKQLTTMNPDKMVFIIEDNR